MSNKGNISIRTENIFPIIKKFLYADQEVFLRELVANAVDATKKLQQLASMGKYKGEVDDLKITVSIDAQQKTITISDRGLGMTEEEVKKYINEVAFSGATDFLNQHKEETNKQDLIGFFGLGFYAAFMVADRVEIVTKSYKEKAEAVHWQCEGSTEFEMNKTVKKERGTDVILHLSEDASSFLQPTTLQLLLNKYCKFLPVPIVFNGKTINHPNPTWIKAPNQLKEEDYQQFYQILYPGSPPPLFWIHLNVDYPFQLTGILYFPALQPGFELQQDNIQLYAKQMFVTQQIESIVPEFLRLLQGVIDSPDIPLHP